jgi:hypothetical protein
MNNENLHEAMTKIFKALNSVDMTDAAKENAYLIYKMLQVSLPQGKTWGPPVPTFVTFVSTVVSSQ